MAKLTVSMTGADSIIQQLEKLADAKGLVKAGILEGAQNKDVLEYAPAQEFGAKIKVTAKMRGFLAANYDIHLKASTTHIVIPPRPFMRTTFQQHWREWVEILASALRAGVAAEVALEHVGMRMQDDIIAQILSNMPPPNSAATTMIKQKEAPGAVGRTLYKTGRLAHSIDYQVIPE